MSSATEITAKELWDRLHGSASRSFFILDVRNAEEASRWKVEGAVEVPTVAIPYFEFIDDADAALAKVPTDLGEAVVICAKGGSSEFVADLMREAGREAVNMQGGMIAWGDLHVPLRVELDRDDQERFELWQFNRYGKGCLSYMVISGGEAAVVDPSRFPELYEDFARERGARIREVLETHVHADHISGGAELARRSGASYRVLNANGREPVLGVDISSFDSDETRIRIGGEGGVAISARALRTPGHTPGSMSYLVADKYLLSGDTLFVQGVGRPDLGGHVEEWGRALHRTLREVVAHLPGSITVLPAHFSSTHEAGANGVVQGNLGRLRDTAPEFAIESEQEFVDAMKAAVREPPAIYGEIIKANLGLVDPGDQAGEWELGKNECAASAAARRARAA